ncbi:MAG: sulfatase-like hydrolase/transferase, partial [Desulfatiglandales bacterium]
IIINIANISIYQITKPKVAPDEPAEATGATAPASGIPQSLPDIYFIILDEYAHPETMKEWYDYDNSRFINSLEDKGFYIVNRSKTRTLHTPQAIAQVLNMEYLTPGWYWDKPNRNWAEIVAKEDDYPGDAPWSEATYQKIGYNKVVDFLKSKGYKFIYFGNFQAPGRYEQSIKDNTDLYVNCYASDGGSIVNEFQHTLWKTSMLRPFYHYIAGRQCESYYRRGVLNQIEHLKKVPDMESPKLVFAHFMCPHEPFAFDPSGEFIAPVNYDTYEDKQFYLGQYIFISAEIEKVIDTLLKKSKNPPVIILQSDHGLRPHHPGIVIGSGEWQKILNAWYLPGDGKERLYASMSPVNTFRLVFNHYFGADYELLEDD